MRIALAATTALLLLVPTGCDDKPPAAPKVCPAYEDGICPDPEDEQADDGSDTGDAEPEPVPADLPAPEPEWCQGYTGNGPSGWVYILKLEGCDSVPEHQRPDEWGPLQCPNFEACAVWEDGHWWGKTANLPACLDGGHEVEDCCSRINAVHACDVDPSSEGPLP